MSWVISVILSQAMKIPYEQLGNSEIKLLTWKVVFLDVVSAAHI